MEREHRPDRNQCTGKDVPATTGVAGGRVLRLVIGGAITAMGTVIMFVDAWRFVGRA